MVWILKILSRVLTLLIETQYDWETSWSVTLLLTTLDHLVGQIRKLIRYPD